MNKIGLLAAGIVMLTSQYNYGTFRQAQRPIYEK